MPDPVIKPHPDHFAGQGVYVWHMPADFDRHGNTDFPKDGEVRRMADKRWKATAPGTTKVGYGLTRKEAVLALTNVNQT